jgi:hypothetical protein
MRPGFREGLRFAMYLTPLALVGVVGGLFYRQYYEKDRLIAEQKRIISQLELKLDRSWAEELVADVRVRSVGVDPDTGKANMELTFIQYQPGTEIPSFERSMTLPGEEFYIDALVVQFDRKFVEAGDGLRGKSLLMFRRAFGDQQKPVDGVPLFRGEGRSPIPEMMQVDNQPTEFETKIWTQFWDYANDPTLAAAQGIRVAQGEAPHIRAVSGQVYKLTLRSSGGLDIVPRLPAAVVGNGPPRLDAGAPR